jgi:hypothetical protein
MCCEPFTSSTVSLVVILGGLEGMRGFCAEQVAWQGGILDTDEEPRVNILHNCTEATPLSSGKRRCGRIGVARSPRAQRLMLHLPNGLQQPVQRWCGDGGKPVETSVLFPRHGCHTRSNR